MTSQLPSFPQTLALCCLQWFMPSGRGIAVCHSCGSYSTERRSALARALCGGSAHAPRQKAVKRIAKGLHPADTTPHRDKKLELRFLH